MNKNRIDARLLPAILNLCETSMAAEAPTFVEVELWRVAVAGAHPGIALRALLHGSNDLVFVVAGSRTLGARD